MKLLYKFLLFTLCLGATERLSAQVSIKGPVCVSPGTLYHYSVQGKWDSLSRVMICITGGKLEDGEICTPNYTALSDIYVIWSDEPIKKLHVQSSLMDTIIQIQSTAALSGGLIDSLSRIQAVDTIINSYSISCSAASGGDCETTYEYQWQISTNTLDWINITDANNATLLFKEKVMVNTFLRRQVLEKRSNTIAYSDMAILTVPFNNGSSN